MRAVLQPNEGERVVLSAPLCGEIIIKTDPAIVGGLTGMALQTLPAGGVIPIHRYLHHPLFVWVVKGQGRVAVDNRQYTVVPGHALVVPAGQWYGLRNTGTGLFQVLWVGPQALFSFFRSLSQAGQPLDQAALAALAQPYGIEFQSGSEALLTPMVRPERRLNNRHRRNRSPRAARPANAAPRETPVQPSGAPAPQKPAAASSRPPGRKPSSRKPSRYGRTKEVFMGGKWVRVSGEGPIVASGDK